MKSYYIFRHGETYYSKHVVPYGEHEKTAHILPEAKPSIKRIGKQLAMLPIDLAIRSEFLRCEETCAIVEEDVKFTFTPHPLLNEFTETDFHVFHNRMQSLAYNLHNSPATAIALCTHGAIVAALQKMLLGKPFGAHDLMYYPKTGVIVKITGDLVEEIDFND